jgi:HEAT repeat protein
VPDGHLLAVVAAGIGALLAGALGATAVGKLVRGVADERSRRAEARVRPGLIRLVLGAGDDRLTPDRSVTRGADARAVERIATDLLAKLRGEAYDDVVAVLDQRGVLARARRQLRDGRTRWGSGARRARAAELLGAARDTQAVPDLLAVARTHRRREVRIDAARALGRIGDPVAVPGLLDGLDGRLPVRTVSQAILQIGAPAEPILRRELQSGTAPARALAARILGLSGSVSAGRDLAHAIATDPHPDVRASAAASAGLLGLPYAVDALVDALGAVRSRGERAASAEALGHMSATASSEALAPLVAEPDPRIAHAAACALAGLGAAGRAYLEAFSTGDDVAAQHAREALRRAA